MWGFAHERNSYFQHGHRKCAARKHENWMNAHLCDGGMRLAAGGSSQHAPDRSSAQGGIGPLRHPSWSGSSSNDAAKELCMATEGMPLHPCTVLFGLHTHPRPRKPESNFMTGMCCKLRSIVGRQRVDGEP